MKKLKEEYCDILGSPLDPNKIRQKEILESEVFSNSSPYQAEIVYE